MLDMIVRKRNLNINSSEVQLAICYGGADVKRWVTRFVRILITAPEYVEGFRKARFTEQDVRHWLTHDAWALAAVEEPWQGQLSQWAWKRMLALGYFTQSGSEETSYYLSEKAIKLCNFKSLNWQ